MAGFDLATMLSAISGGKKPLTVPAVVPQVGAGGLPLGAGEVGIPNAPAVIHEADSIFGMSPDQFAVVAGGIAEALAPKDSFQQQLGAFAGGLGKGGITEEALRTPVTGAELKKKEVPKKSKLQDKIDLSNTLLEV